MSKYGIKMVYEYDSAKSDANSQKHGIDFHEAQRLWDMPYTQTVARKYDEEQRWLIIGTIDNTHWTAAITYREKSIRIISVRRSRQSEIALHKSNSYEQEETRH